MIQSNMDFCLFIRKKLMAIIYVEDILFWHVNENDIHKKLMQLCKQGVNLEQEDHTTGFLGVTLGRDEATDLMEMNQVGIINCVIETLGLYDGMAKSKYNPSESKTLVKDVDGSAQCVTFSYNSMVGMLLYHSGHTRPDIAYSVHFGARYLFCLIN